MNKIVAILLIIFSFVLSNCKAKKETAFKKIYKIGSSNEIIYSDTLTVDSVFFEIDLKIMKNDSVVFLVNGNNGEFIEEYKGTIKFLENSLFKLNLICYLSSGYCRDPLMTQDTLSVYFDGFILNKTNQNFGELTYSDNEKQSFDIDSKFINIPIDKERFNWEKPTVKMDFGYKNSINNEPVIFKGHYGSAYIIECAAYDLDTIDNLIEINEEEVLIFDEILSFTSLNKITLKKKN